MDHKKPIGIYVHIPFCVRKCLYCDFLSFPCGEDRENDKIWFYMSQLYKEIDTFAPVLAKEYYVETVFFGGGTPSFIDESCIGKVMDKLRRHFSFAENAEVTIEVNPGTVEEEKLRAYRMSGINRISMGVQSFVDTELMALGRIHDAKTAVKCYDAARNAGFDNVSLDLMTGIPGQDEESLLKSLSVATMLGPEHVSAYSLIVEEGTPFEKMYPNGAVDEDMDRRLYDLTEEVLLAAGHKRYEISNYALDGKECRHNLAYWLRRDYVGFGIGAASLIGKRRFSNVRSLRDYYNIRLLDNGLLSCHQDVEELSREDEISEAMFLGLRLTDGISLSEVNRRYDTDVEQLYQDVIGRHEDEGMLIREGDRLRLSKAGLSLANYVMSDFV